MNPSALKPGLLLIVLLSVLLSSACTAATRYTPSNEGQEREGLKPDADLHTRVALPGEPRTGLGLELRAREARCPSHVTPKPPATFTPLSLAGTLWVIHAKGVGDIHTGRPIPDSVLKLVGKSYRALYFDPIEGKDELQQMREGHMDQAGFRTIHLDPIDVTTRMTLTDRVLDLRPGPRVRTAQGAGLGSSLAELISAHGDYTLHPIPEPYRCSVELKNLPGVYFQFSACEAACAGGKVKRVTISGGFDPPDAEMP